MGGYLSCVDLVDREAPALRELVQLRARRVWPQLTRNVARRWTLGAVPVECSRTAHPGPNPVAVARRFPVAGPGRRYAAPRPHLGRSARPQPRSSPGGCGWKRSPATARSATTANSGTSCARCDSSAAPAAHSCWVRSASGIPTWPRPYGTSRSVAGAVRAVSGICLFTGRSVGVVHMWSREIRSVEFGITRGSGSGMRWPRCRNVGRLGRCIRSRPLRPVPLSCG